MSVGCARCHGAGWVCEEHPTEPMDHDRCGGPGMLCTCPIGQDLEQRLDKRRAPAATGDETLWTLTKAGSRARAVARKVLGVGIELRFLWNDDTRETKVYRNTDELAAAAGEKRAELIERGWIPELPPMWST